MMKYYGFTEPSRLAVSNSFKLASVVMMLRIITELKKIRIVIATATYADIL